MKALLFAALPLTLVAQLSPPQQITNTGNPPIVFLNGYQAGCQDPSFNGTFGAADRTLAPLNQPILYFDNCTASRGSIEDLGNAFGRYLDNLRYADGTRVSQVDAIAHSMGGLIVRSYLAGRQNDGTYTPPADPRIRKIIFLATPHAGTSLAALAVGLDPQLEDLAPGSDFLFGLGTWNQGREDLRGIEAMSLMGDAGSGLFTVPRFTDGVVALTSGSLEAWLPGRTRVLPNYCHTSNSPCVANALSIADLTDTNRDSVKAVLSYLSGTQEWRSLGRSPADLPALANTSGLQAQFHDSTDRVLQLSKVTATGQGDLAIRGNRTAWTDRIPGQTLQLTATAADNTTVGATIELPKTGTSFNVFKSGPFIAAALPAAQAVTPRAVAPGQFVSIYGSQLASGTAASVQPYPATLSGTEVRIGAAAVPTQYASPTQINVLVPEDAANFIRITVLNAAGQHSINALVEPAVPALFAGALNAVTGALITESNPLRAGDYVALFLTGLGRTQRRTDGLDWAQQQPEVTVGERPCSVTYAGRAPGFAGLDQINCSLAADVTPNTSAAVTVRSGKRVSTSSLPVR